MPNKHLIKLVKVFLLSILDDIFIIGGLVDRTIQKYASLNRAEKLGIPARSLPIKPFIKQRSCLNLDHILSIVCKFI